MVYVKDKNHNIPTTWPVGTIGITRGTGMLIIMKLAEMESNLQQWILHEFPAEIGEKINCMENLAVFTSFLGSKVLQFSKKKKKSDYGNPTYRVFFHGL